MRLTPPSHDGAATLARGDRIDCGAMAVTAEMIDTFADMTGDRFEILMSDATAQRHGLGAGRARAARDVLDRRDEERGACASSRQSVTGLALELPSARARRGSNCGVHHHCSIRKGTKGTIRPF